MGLAALGVGSTLSGEKKQATRYARGDTGMDDDFERIMRLASVPSMAYAIVDGDKISTKALGVRRAGEAERVTADTVYAAASLTKTVFSYVLLGLVNEGLLTLDRPAREYLPLPNPDDPRAAGITLRRLLSHSSGWRNWRFDTKQPLTSDFEPGTKWSYSGEGFFYMQRILEKLTGKGMSQLAHERVFEPLGMKRSSMVALGELEPFLADPHSGRGEVIPTSGRPTLLELRRAMAERGVSLAMVKTEDSEAASRVAEPALPVLPVFLNPNAAGGQLRLQAHLSRQYAEREGDGGVHQRRSWSARLRAHHPCNARRRSSRIPVGVTQMSCESSASSSM